MAADPTDPTTVLQPISLPSTANLVNPIDRPYLTFPPFPEAPEGVTITPFKEFMEGGICVEPGVNDLEVDTLGIPTVPIKTRHNTDECKTKTKRKRTAENSKGKKAQSVQRLWWEQWEDTEVIRFSTGFNPHASHYERIIAAAADFTSGRVWPVNFASETGPKFIWAKFQRYIGVQEGATVPSVSQIKKEQLVLPEEDEDEDDCSDDEMELAAMEIDQADGPGIIPDPDTGLIDVKKIQVPAPGKPKQLTEEQKLKSFFDDPEKSIRVFMTSYSRSMGYIWADDNLDCIPRVLGFFVNFLLRSKVLPEIERELRRSLQVITLAMTELPNTSGIAKAFPDKFSSACNACWGQKADGYTTLTVDVPDEEPEEPANEEPEAKRQKCDTDMAQTSGPAATEPEKETPATTTDTWASGGDSNSGVSWGQEIEVIEDSPWSLLEVDKPESLLPLLGPTALPLTHSPGIVERSMRRIVSITRPPPSVSKSPPLADGISEPNSAAVELELDRRFAKIVLAPMIDWDGGEAPVYTKPTILATSRGRVVESDATAQPTLAEGSPRPHNPASDEITLLIDNTPVHIDRLREQMAIGGTWVQLVRRGEPTAAKKKKGKSKHSTSSYWYIDELAIVVPSFWTVATDN
ncbi:hypothetical protein BYT27DRAFT_7141748 [Phlegmacium glaucopus]|nr:hypothetical protein BYT27DRAFT_7141748 [Phlegmacium glaucopus]